MKQDFDDVFPPNDGGLHELILLSSDGEPETFDVGESGAQVELAARDGDEVPYDLRVTHAGMPLHTASVSEEFFGPGIARERFTTVAGRRLAGVADDVDEAVATTALEDVLEDIRDRFAADEVHVVDEEARELVEKTAAVTYSPNGSGDLVVTFDDADFSGNNFAFYRTQEAIPARQWTGTPDSPRIDGVRRVFDGAAGRARWQTVRRIWLAIADGDVPPAEIELTASDLRERGTVPKIDVDLDDLREALDEHTGFDDVRQELDVSRPQGSILRAAIEKLDLDSDVEYGMVKP